ncbi:hypothetical protein H2200_007208 [Cladophialophora chaetospira]|uniref:NTF2-like domain-containing protein n=1 Tax=Cladophialophora chaetospira TaxID=386627 RepID=A0AA38X7D7_9EURO|nr:hypothetical protein H2200_007208 [Cladophialophora chaetospira]
MRSALLATFFAFVAIAFAVSQSSWADWSTTSSAPGHGSNGNGPNGPHNGIGGSSGKCLDDSDVTTFINGYTYLLEHPGGPNFNQTANTILSDNFTVWSDSINIMGTIPLGTPTWTSLADFIKSESYIPPLPTVSTLSTFHNCDQISWRWTATGVKNADAPIADPVPVAGIITFSVNVTSNKIETVSSEFNTAVFAHNIGNPECQSANDGK